ncbi:pyridoxamine 5'-phosphate oxidase family protein [Halalkalicoccus sp. NIPERK01]|uniref:pyridoxamine 5'-phosphate oxidase family protein n=1 Tax=Halalkalicoccus sp. NIPERK01 TaxID=3053469 RepID=UPI00256EC3EF|nr:pyridoxamine 5'-phosphate oxidase family protein [Halalkalicoccus sp. NIPERK01]MDL5361126.1 pyridoxamine 5'-phosphate oxidase family protein [Halalkalicoccus sp. NIPERK01]
MSDSTPVEMDDDERDAFLGTGGIGVMAFPTADGDPPHAIPVSYGYDATETTFYFRLAVGDDREKGDVAGETVAFVTYGREGSAWESVIATGRLEETTAEPIATETLQGLERVHIPLVDVFGEPPRTVSFGYFRLVPERLTSRKESRTEV